MELKQLRYFVEIVNAGSMRGAASRLHVAQPALSRKVQQLEHELGLTLLHRHTHGISPTAAGARLQSFAADIIRRVDDVRASLVDSDEPLRGTITIGAPTMLSQLVFGRLIARTKADHPDITIRMIEGNDYYHLIPGLETQRIDVAMVVYTDAHAGFTYYPLVTEKIYLVGRPGDPFLNDGGRQTVQIAELEEVPLAVWDKSAGPRRLFDRAAGKADIIPQIVYEAGSAGVMRDLVAQGLAFGVMSYSSIRQQLLDNSLTAVPIEQLTMMRAVAVNEDKANSPIISALVTIIQSEFDALTEQGIFGPE